MQCRSPKDGSSSRASVRVVIEDNGHGIPAEHRPHVFTPFYTTKREGRGTGLGLSIVRSIVRNHDGEIAVDEEGPAVGTRFVLRLPLGGRA
jgi:signal transduction histidine kinase